MDCPECGTALATYLLDGRDASVCERCGYVGIEAEHGGAGSRIESWTDALRRFYGDDDDLTLPVPQSEPAGRDDESWTDALRRFYGTRTAGDEGLSSLDTAHDGETADGGTTDDTGTEADTEDAETEADTEDAETEADEATPARVPFDGRSVIGRGDDEAEPAPAADGSGADVDG